AAPPSSHDALPISYRAVLRLGSRTDTGDVTGAVLETRPGTAGEAELLAALPRFVGPQMQVPPMYSAVKVDGQPLYKAARQGLTVERKARPIQIYGIRYEGSPAPGVYALTVECSKGTYIRTLLEDLAAEYMGGTCICGPTKRGSAASSSASPAVTGRVSSTAPVTSPVSVRLPSRRTAR